MARRRVSPTRENGGVAIAPPETSTRPLTERSAGELAAAIRARELTASEVVEAHIEVLRRVNPRINAVVVERYDAAREEAEAADARVAAAAAGEELPPLLGVPCTIKGSFGLPGHPQWAGLVARRDHVAERAAPAVQRLLDAGAIPLGLTNTSELTLWVETDNRVYGRTNNPYDLRRTAGGS